MSELVHGLLVDCVCTCAHHFLCAAAESEHVCTRVVMLLIIVDL